MKLIRFNLVVLSSVGLLFLGACGNGNEIANTENTATANTETPTTEVKPIAKSSHQHGPTKGGQVVETGNYHLEFLAEPEAGGSHLDLYLLTGDTHATVPNANVTALVQMPDGQEKTVLFTYSDKDKHYIGMLNVTASGQYQVRITANFNGERVNGRFSFNR